MGSEIRDIIDRVIAALKAVVPVTEHRRGDEMDISENEGCTKIQLYAAVSRNGTMPRKLDDLESAGLIEQKMYRDPVSVRLYMTDLGRRVTGKLSEISRME